MDRVILRDRKEIKKKGHQVFRSHYLVLAFLCIILILSGEEFTLSRVGLGEMQKEVQEEQEAQELVPSAGKVLTMLLNGQRSEGEEVSRELKDSLTETADGNGAFNRTEGVLATLVNDLASGSLYIRISQLIFSITRSDRAVQVFFILGMMFWGLFVYVFVKNVYAAAVRRCFLEARVYKTVKPTGALHILSVHKFLKASLTLAVRDLFLFLWVLTIIGGFVKGFSYWAVPYIVAENPDIGPLEAIRLSRRMMNGHKWEVFLFQLSLAPWAILGILTFGLSDMAYGAPFRLSCYCEVYARIRQEAIEKGIEGTKLLRDKYLFRRADRIKLAEAYFDVVDELTISLEERVPLTGAKKFFSEWFGIWLGGLKNKQLHDQAEARFAMASGQREQMVGEAYPRRLDPLYRPPLVKRKRNFYYLRDYSVWTLVLFFLLCAFIGWSWEVTLHYMQTQELANRGVLFGPWLPIYGAGATFVLVLCNRFRRYPVAEFFVATILCGILEYGTSVYLERMYNERWWSYDGYFLNIHGRVCAEGLLAFGIGCMIIIYLVAPLFDYILQGMDDRALRIICLVLSSVFLLDVAYSTFHPNMAPGAIEEKKVQAVGEHFRL